MRLRQCVSGLLIALGLWLVGPDSHGQHTLSSPPASRLNWSALADSSSQALNTQFYNQQGQYYNENNAGSTKFNYWPQAHALDVLVDAYERTKDPRYLTRMNDWFVGVPIKNGQTFLNEYYDDMGWNALAILRAYEVTKDKKWLDTALLLWNDIKLGWNETMGGGIAWRKGQRAYKNTPANAPAIILAARLYQQLNQPDDLVWAQKINAWQQKNLVDPATGFVYDGINRQGDGKLDLNWKFTYNQGLMIGAGLALFRATSDRTHLDAALKTANHALIDPGLTRAGLLKPEGNGDGGLFKAVLVRYLALLANEPAVPATTRKTYSRFLTTNAETLWQKGTRKPALVFGPDWAVAPADDKADMTTQLSGAVLLEAMTRLKP